MKTFSQFLEDTGTGNHRVYEKERIRRKYDIPSPQQFKKERRLAYMLQRDLPPPKNKSIF